MPEGTQSIEVPFPQSGNPHLKIRVGALPPADRPRRRRLGFRRVPRSNRNR